MDEINGNGDNTLSDECSENSNEEPPSKEEVPFDEEVDNTEQAVGPGTIDKGRSYESRIAALLALRCTLNKNVKNFWMYSNQPGLKAFDDIVLRVQYLDRRVLYLIQLKHTGTVTASNLEALNKGDFALKKYEESYEEVKKNCGILKILKHISLNEIVFMLYTSAKLTQNKSKNLKLIPAEDIDFINTSTGSKAAHRIISNCDIYNKNFLNQFFLYTNQAKAGCLEDTMKHEFFDVDKNIIKAYTDFFDTWAVNPKMVKIDRNKTVEKLLLCTYAHYVPIPSCLETEPDEKVLRVLMETIKKFNFTTISSENRCLQYLWRGVQNIVREICRNDKLDLSDWVKSMEYDETKKITDVVPPLEKHRNSKGQLSIKDIYFYLVSVSKIPLIVSYGDAVADCVNKILQKLFLDQNTYRTFVVVNSKLEVEQIKSSITLFENFSNVDKDLTEQNLKNINIRLQGRQKVNLYNVCETNSKVLKEITPNVYINLLTEGLDIDETYEVLSYHIGRKVNMPMLQRRVLKEKKCLVVLNKADEEALETISKSSQMDFELYFEELKKYLHDVKKLNKDESLEFIHKNINILTTNLVINESLIETTEKMFQLITKLHKHSDQIKNALYLLKYNDLTSLLELQYSFGSTEYLVSYIQKHPVMENILLQYSTSPVNIICSDAGMGKSVMLYFLTSLADANEWVAYINLIEHNTSIYKIVSTKFKNLTEYFFQLQLKNVPERFHSFCKELFMYCLESKKLTWFVDGYDEVHSAECKLFLQEVKKLGIKLWVSTRPSVKTELENALNTFSIDIYHFTKQNQRNFLKKYYKSNNIPYNDDDIDNIIKIIEYSSLDESLIGIPLQLRMFADIVNLKRDFKTIKKYTIVKLYEEFVNLKLSEYGDRSKSFYNTISKLALTLFFTEETLEELFDEWDDFSADVKSFKTNKKDFIVSGFTQDDEPLFSHRTYAEYLTAAWLASKIHRVKGKKTVVNVKYTKLVRKLFFREMVSIKIFFNQIVVDELPLHLAVLSNDAKTVEEILNKTNDGINQVDKLGRTPLHIMTGYGKYCDMYRNEDIAGIINVQDHVKVFTDTAGLKIVVPKDKNLASGHDLKILRLLLKNGRIEEKEQIFGFDVIEYGMKACSLEMIDRIYGAKKVEQDLVDVDSHTFNLLLYQCLEHNLNNILTKYCNDARPNVKKQIQTPINSKTLLHIAVLLKNLEAVKMLIKTQCFKVDARSGDDTPLHTASKIGCKDIVACLIDLGANVNAVGRNKSTPLVYACLSGKENVVDLLLRKNANSNYIYKKRPLLLHAISSGNKNLVQLLIDKGADINYCDKPEKSPLTVACRLGLVDIVEMLLNKGAEIVDPKMILYDACRAGNVSILELFLDKGFDKDMQDHQGKTALIHACNFGHSDIFEALLNEGANIDICDNEGRNVLIYACIHTNVKIVEHLLTIGVNINSKDKNGKTALMYACCTIERLIDVAEILIKRGANVNLEDNEGQTALMYACGGDSRGRNGSIVQLLLDNNANVFHEDKNGTMALMVAVTSNNAKIVESLLAKGVDINGPDHNGKTPVMYACGGDYITRHLYILEYLVKNGADIQPLDLSGRTPLIYACMGPVISIKIVKYLLSMKVEVGPCDCDGRNALMYALKAKNEEAAKLLMEKDYNPNMADKHGKTIFMYAVWAGFEDIAKNMYNKNIDVNITDNLERTAFIYACQGDNPKVVDMLINKVMNIDAVDKYGRSGFFYACLGKNIELMELLLNHKANINLTDEYGYNALTYCCKHGNCASAEVLLKYVTEEDLKTSDENGRSVFLNACYGGFYRIVELILKKGFDMKESVDGYGKNGLIFSSMSKNVKLTLTLLKEGFDINSTDNNNKTVLMYACEFGPYQQAIELLKHGADFTRKDNDGKTVLMYACQVGSFNVVVELMKKNVELNEADNFDKTALMYACAAGLRDIVAYLLKNGDVDVRKEDKDGKTAYNYAQESRSQETLSLIKSKLED